MPPGNAALQLGTAQRCGVLCILQSACVLSAAPCRCQLHVNRIAEMGMRVHRAAAAALRTVYKKYSHSNHSKVSLLQPPLSLLEEA